MDIRHEKLHLGDATLGTNWMENIYFGGRDIENAAAFGIHLKLRAEIKRAEVRCFIDIGGSDAGFGGRYALADSLEYPILNYECIEPFKRWRIKMDTIGWPLAETGGTVGLELADRTPSVPFGFELDVVSTLPPADWADLRNVEGSDSAGHGHYDMSFSFSGTLYVGDKRIDASGLGMRDHSWGPRNFTGLKGVWFIGATYENESAYFAGVRSWDENDKVSGFSYLIKDGKFTVLPCPQFTMIEGNPEPGEYKVVEVTTEGVKLLVRVQKHMPMPLLPEKYLSNGTSCMLETGTGTGYAMLERGLLYSDDEIQDLIGRLGALS